MPDRTRRPLPRDKVETARDRGAWFRQPVFWLGGLIFAVSLGACVATIVLALRHADADAPVEAGARVMGVPVRDAMAAPPSASKAR